MWGLYKFKKYKMKVYDMILEYFHTTPMSWDFFHFPNIDEFVHKAWDMAKEPDKDMINVLMNQYYKDSSFKMKKKPTILDPERHIPKPTASIE